MFEKQFYSFVMPYIKKTKTDTEREFRAGKSSKYMFRFVYFSCAVAWGFKVLINEPYMPKALGGSGDLSLMWVGFPYSYHRPGLKQLILVLSGYHLGGLVTHFLTSRKNDFIEMGLHHIVAIYLYGGCYLFNATQIGSVIALIHDIADITTGLTKALAETKYGTATAVAFVTHMILWFYTRLVLLPWSIYMIWVSEVDFGNPIVKPTFCYLLFCMFMLHCYWYKMFCSLLSKYMNTGSTEDT